MSKKPMTGQPFYFDEHVFDEDPLAGLKDDSTPEFSKAELNEEKKKAYEEGKAQGFQESEAGLTKTLLSVLQKIERDTAVLFAAEHDRNRQYEGEVISLSFSIIRKLFPLYVEKYGEDELKSAIKSALSDHNTPEKITIELPTDLLPSLEKYIKDKEVELNKQITLTANPNLQSHECRILWPDGGVICNQTDIAEKTFAIMKEALADRGISVHDEDEVIDEAQEQPDKDVSDTGGDD